MAALLAPHPRRVWPFVPGLASALIGVLDSVVSGRRRVPSRAEAGGTGAGDLAESRLKGTGGMEGAIGEEAAGALAALCACSLGDINVKSVPLGEDDVGSLSLLREQARSNLLGPILRALVQLSQARTPRLVAAALPLLDLVTTKCMGQLLGIGSTDESMAASADAAAATAGTGAGTSRSSATGPQLPESAHTSALIASPKGKRVNALLAVLETMAALASKS